MMCRICTIIGGQGCCLPNAVVLPLAVIGNREVRGSPQTWGETPQTLIVSWVRSGPVESFVRPSVRLANIICICVLFMNIAAV